jgi:hypothetical protein
MKIKIIILTIALICVFFCGNASAYDYEASMLSDITPPPPFNVTTNQYTQTWFSNVTGEFDACGFMLSLTMPFTAIVGSYLYIIVYALYLYSVWDFSSNLALVSTSLCVTLPLWYLLFPPESYMLLLVVIALGIGSIFYKLFARR